MINYLGIAHSNVYLVLIVLTMYARTRSKMHEASTLCLFLITHWPSTVKTDTFSNT